MQTIRPQGCLLQGLQRALRQSMSRLLIGVSGLVSVSCPGIGVAVATETVAAKPATVVVTAATPAEVAKVTTADPAIERISVSFTSRPSPWLSSSAAIVQRQLETAFPALDSAGLLNGLSGLQADQRANFAQDSRLSLRGFGSRSSFGVRGIEITLDGIPLSTPDGQIQLSNILLNNLAQVELLKGPFAGLYGNAAGGVIALQSKPLQQDLLQYSSQGSAKYYQQQLLVGSTIGEFALQRLQHQGYRPQNSAEKRQAFWRDQYELNADLKLQLRLDWSDDPLLQDPQALTFNEWQQNPVQTAANAVQFDSHKAIAQRQASLRLTSSHWHLNAWQGKRAIEQWLAFSGEAITGSGGIVALQRQFQGAEWQYQQQLGIWSWQVSTTAEQSRDQRQGYVNNRGQVGALRRDETGLVRSTDQAFRTSAALSADWQFNAGIRFSQLQFDVDDRFITDGNPDDSGSHRFNGSSWALGLSHALSDNLWWYLSRGAGFETPTLTEMAYRLDGAGLNLQLEASNNQQWDTGIKWQHAGRTLTMDLFQIRSQNELLIARSSGGRTVYRNAAATTRYGGELTLIQPLSALLQLEYQLSYLHAYFEQQVSGNKPLLPGISRLQHHLNLQYLPYTDDRWQLTATWHWQSRQAADDLNLQFAPSSQQLRLQSRWQWQLDAWQWHSWIAVDNATDQQRVAAVVVNQSSGRSFEPAPPRQWLVGVQIQYQLD